MGPDTIEHLSRTDPLPNLKTEEEVREGEVSEGERDEEEGEEGGQGLPRDNYEGGTGGGPPTGRMVRFLKVWCCYCFLLFFLSFILFLSFRGDGEKQTGVFPPEDGTLFPRGNMRLRTG